jgi:hypothetical protein
LASDSDQRARHTPNFQSSWTTKHLLLSPNSSINNPSMCCALRHLPVTDFLSDHPFNMSDRGSLSPHRRREDTLTHRTALPSREMATQTHQASQPQSTRSNTSGLSQERENGPSPRESPTPQYELQRPDSSSPTAERMRQPSPRSNSAEHSRRELSQSFNPVPAAVAASPDSVPTGQICR